MLITFKQIILNYINLCKSNIANKAFYLGMETVGLKFGCMNYFWEENFIWSGPNFGLINTNQN